MTEKMLFIWTLYSIHSHLAYYELKNAVRLRHPISSLISREFYFWLHRWFSSFGQVLDTDLGVTVTTSAEASWDLDIGYII